MIHERQIALKAALERKILSPDNPSVIFHDLTSVKDRLSELTRAFPSTAIHTVAIKANPVVNLLRWIVRMGFGLEAASLEEVYLALAAGCATERIVYDSPAKTTRDLKTAMTLGIYINADSFQELDRIVALRKEVASTSRIGVRLNPLVGKGSIEATSVSHRQSKFGIPLDTGLPKILEYFEAYPWLTGIHIHVGSQGYQISRLVEGIRIGFQAIQEIEKRCGVGRVETFDIGGGLPVRYHSDQKELSISEYSKALSSSIPELFHSSLRIMTELGRAIHARAGWAVSRVEYVKRTSEVPDANESKMAVIHLGADFLLRRAYQPKDWHHEITVLDSVGNPKGTEKLSSWTVGGPLCFGGDIIAQDILLPEVKPGDWLVIHDIGAYTLGMWSRYCSRSMPSVLGYEKENPALFRVLRKRETPEDLVAFWSSPEELI